VADNSENDQRIDYVEFVVRDIGRTKAFYAAAFGWQMTDYGPDYAAFFDGRLNGGFTTGEPKPGGPLVILFASDLAATQRAVEDAGGTIVRTPFAFPGGRRFHFTDPDGYELAVWGDPS
jgi:predicted enzyme related to lactoylglutathione lyase